MRRCLNTRDQGGLVRKKIAMSKLNKRAIIGAVAVAVVATAVVIIVLRPTPHLEDLPVVGVDTVRTRNVEI